VATLVNHPKLVGVEKVYLTTSHQQNFYEKLGFIRNDTATMILDQRPAMDLSLINQFHLDMGNTTDGCSTLPK
jgi:N-acetylglutamate synthase-like GNAT family acetyltransferase